MQNNGDGLVFFALRKSMARMECSWIQAVWKVHIWFWCITVDYDALAYREIYETSYHTENCACQNWLVLKFICPNKGNFAEIDN